MVSGQDLRNIVDPILIMLVLGLVSCLLYSFYRHKKADVTARNWHKACRDIVCWIKNNPARRIKTDTAWHLAYRENVAWKEYVRYNFRRKEEEEWHSSLQAALKDKMD